ncbi:MAG: Na+-transporting NADH:ubiquinone oxidoreductase subunit A [Candidatus Marinamargulisbacteria bacterium]|jgi:Na+-transporting NADH:ubiquinone oxidoreductase subunit A
MKSINVKNTYDIKITGKPADTLDVVENIDEVAVLPSSIPFIKPKLVVKEGETVQIGSPMFFDKQDPRIQFLSPGAGRIKSIVYGPRRSLKRVIIALDKNESAVSFDRVSDQKLVDMSREELVNRLLAGGVWPVLQSLPFNTIANPDETPPSIYLSIDNDEPYLPNSEVFLKRSEDQDALRFGVKVLQKLSGGEVHVGIAAKNHALLTILRDVITHQLHGQYPANHPGVFLYHNKKSSQENKSWTIRSQELLMIARLLRQGAYPIDRIVTVAGPLAKKPRHLATRQGAPLSVLAGDVSGQPPIRYIGGGVMTGRLASQDSFLGFQEMGLHLIEEGKTPELLYFVRPGADKPSISKTFLSALFKQKKFDMNSSLNGGERSCISCGACPSVCPVDLLPQLVMKSVLAKDIEESIELGILDCVDCGLCTYVCPSKINLDDIITKGKAVLKKEAG